jgi:hypothetical protein
MSALSSQNSIYKSEDSDYEKADRTGSERINESAEVPLRTNENSTDGGGFIMSNESSRNNS